MRRLRSRVQQQTEGRALAREKRAEYLAKFDGESVVRRTTSPFYRPPVNDCLIRCDSRGAADGERMIDSRHHVSG